jgi:predicted RNA polymerase sigma factor
LIERVFREQRGRVLVEMADYVRHFDLAEESTQEPFATALRLPRPIAPISGWVVSVAEVPIGRVERPLRHGCLRQHADPSRAPEDEIAIAADPGRVAVIAVATVL